MQRLRARKLCFTHVAVFLGHAISVGREYYYTSSTTILLGNHHNASSKPIDLVPIETATVHEGGRKKRRERARELERARES